MAKLENLSEMDNSNSPAPFDWSDELSAFPAFPRTPQPNEIYQLYFLPPDSDTVWYADYESDQRGQLHLRFDGRNYDVHRVSMPLAEGAPSWRVYLREDPLQIQEEYIMERHASGPWYADIRGSRRGHAFVYEEIATESDPDDDTAHEAQNNHQHSSPRDEP